MKKLKLLTVLLFSTVILSACSNAFDDLADEINGWLGAESTGSNEEETDPDNGEEPDKDNGTEEDGSTEETADTSGDEDEVEKLDYSHLMNKGEAVTLDEGKHDVGKDIEPGRYTVSTDSGHGGVYVTDDEDLSVFGESLSGESETYGHSPTKVNLILEEGYTVEVSYVDSMNFEPYETQEVNTIYPGQWVVGEDFPEGVYDVSLPETEETGTLEVSAHPEYNKSRHSLGSELYGGMTEFTMSFEDGDVVLLRYIPEVTLTKR